MEHQQSYQTWFSGRTKTSNLFAVVPGLSLSLATSFTCEINTVHHRFRLDSAYHGHFLRRLHQVRLPECKRGPDVEAAPHFAPRASMLLEPSGVGSFTFAFQSLGKRPFSLRNTLDPWSTLASQKLTVRLIRDLLELFLLL